MASLGLLLVRSTYSQKKRTCAPSSNTPHAEYGQLLDVW